MQHPDEGTIHSWLDDALTAEEARVLEAHVATCADCAAAVAEARGMRAAATRILSALDDVPAGVIPAPDYFADIRAASDADAVRRRAGGSFWTRPGIRAAAALVAVGALSWAVVRNVPPARDESSVSTQQANQVADVASTAADTLAAVERVDSAPSAPPAREPARDGARDAASREQARRRVAAQAEARSADEPLRRSELSGRGADLRAERYVTADSSVAVAPAPTAAATAPAPAAPAASRRVDSMVADRAANTTLARSETASRKVAAPVAQGIAEPPAPRIVIERAYVDSVLAADSMETAIELESGGRAVAGVASRAAPSMAADARESVRPPGNPTTMRAQGCWVLETSDWTPRLRARDSVPLLPRRVELRLDRGIISEEAGQRVVRPAPGEPALPAGVTAYWRVIATDQVRFTLTDRDRWTTVTATVASDSLHGTARAYSESDRLLRRATVSARRVVCRTEP